MADHDHRAELGAFLKASRGRRPNMTSVAFLDPDCRALYAGWNRKARSVVATSG